MLDWNRLLASVDKCDFNKDSLEYLGFILGEDGVAMHPSKLATISDWPPPTSVKDIQKFLGFSNFYCCFISHYASIITPLYELTQKTTPFPFTLTDKALKAFNLLKSAFLSAPILIHHSPSKPIFLFHRHIWLHDLQNSTPSRWWWRPTSSLFLFTEAFPSQNQLWCPW